MITGKFFVGASETAGRETYRALDAATGATLEPPFHAASLADVERACELAAGAFDAFREAERRAACALPRGHCRQHRRHRRRADRSRDGRDGLAAAAPRRRASANDRPAAVVRRRRARKGAGSRCASTRRNRSARRGGRICACARCPSVPWRSSAPAIFRWRSPWPAATRRRRSRRAARWWSADIRPTPGVGELVARAIAKAVADCGLPPGVFSFVTGPSHEIGKALVANPHIKAVGFTGSRAGGLALCAVAAARPEPIPVFAEMSSVNPVFLLPGALQRRCGEHRERVRGLADARRRPVLHEPGPDLRRRERRSRPVHRGGRPTRWRAATRKRC